MWFPLPVPLVPGKNLCRILRPIPRIRHRFDKRKKTAFGQLSPLRSAMHAAYRFSTAVQLMTWNQLSMYIARRFWYLR